MGLRKINTIGLKQANKVMHLSAVAYNLKKYLKFIENRTKIKAEVVLSIYFRKNMVYKLKILFLRHSKHPVNLIARI